MRVGIAALVALLLLVGAPVVPAHPETPDCGTDRDAGDNYNVATLVTLPVACDGQLNDTWDSTDFYVIPCVPGETVTAEIETATHETVNLRAYPPLPFAPYVLPPPLAWDYTDGDGHARITFTCLSDQWTRIQLLNGGWEQDQLDIPYRLTIS